APVTQTLVVRPLVLSKEEVNSMLARFWAGATPADNLAIAAQTNYTFVITSVDTTNVTFKVQFTTDLENPKWQDLGLRFVAPNAGYYRMVPQ
ncbi:MAG TPA: hypothetical protein P5525_04765, partial [Candidatus Paceibacterota bacterium]|nr:hypothetical protein [Candidatus Paceibacterota bacterium]